MLPLGTQLREEKAGLPGVSAGVSWTWALCAARPVFLWCFRRWAEGEEKSRWARDDQASPAGCGPPCLAFVSAALAEFGAAVSSSHAGPAMSFSRQSATGPECEAMDLTRSETEALTAELEVPWPPQGTPARRTGRRKRSRR